jgi:acyl-CoA thioesterase FadM
MPTNDFVVTIVPRWADIDLNQHMRHSAFADWAAHARTEWLNANGLTMMKLVELRMAPVMFGLGHAPFWEAPGDFDPVFEWFLQDIEAL